MYFPAWKVKLSFPGGKQEFATSCEAICGDCLAVDMASSPVRARPDCWCQERAHTFAKALLQNRARAWQGERLDALNSWQMRKAEPTCEKVKEVYLSNVPVRGRENYAKNVQRWWSILEEATGKAADGQRVGVLTWDLTLDWVQMRQEYHRRGWSVRGAQLPDDVKDPWVTLRELLKAKKLPPIDKETVSAGNTTIKSYIRAARAVLGQTSRSEYLRGLEIPALTDFLTSKIKLPSPKGHKEIDAADYRAMYEAAPTLRDEDEPRWVVMQMLWRFGCRPIEVWHSKPDWIEHDEEGPFFVLKNRPEQGFTMADDEEESDGDDDEESETRPFAFQLKARERAIERRLRIAPDLWEAMQRVMTAESLIGARTRTAAQNMVERGANKWVRTFLPRSKYGQHGVYLFRHYVGRLVSRLYGTDIASLWLGHATPATLAGRKATITETTYAGGAGSEILPALAWSDLAPRG